MKTRTIILIVAIFLGAGYGAVSAFLNQNPYYTVPGEYDGLEKDMAKAWHWQPSPVWLPSYLLCKFPRNGIGITHTKSGYLFRTEAKRNTYFVISSILGAIMGAIIGGGMLFLARRRKKERGEQKGPANSGSAGATPE